jgi:hypothetical protein
MKSANLRWPAARLEPAISRHAENAAVAASTLRLRSCSLTTYTLSATKDSSPRLQVLIVSPGDDATYCRRNRSAHGHAVYTGEGFRHFCRRRKGLPPILPSSSPGDEVNISSRCFGKNPAKFGKIRHASQ